MGDSSTRGPSDRDYPDILREQLGEPTDAFANEGHGGETTAEGLERLKQLISWEVYPSAHTLLYWQGGADIIDFVGEVDPLFLLNPDSGLYLFTGRLEKKLDEIQKNIEDVIETAQSAGWTVYVATYFLAREEVGPCENLFLDTILPSQARHGNSYIRRLNERIRLAATDTGAVLVDVAVMTEVLQKSEDNYFDCNHLSAQGNAIVAEVFYNVVSAQ